MQLSQFNSEDFVLCSEAECKTEVALPNSLITKTMNGKFIIGGLESKFLNGIEMAQFSLNHLNLFDAKQVKELNGLISSGIELRSNLLRCDQMEYIRTDSCENAFKAIDLKADYSHKLVEIRMKQSFADYLKKSQLNSNFNLTLLFFAPKNPIPEINLTLIRSQDTVIYVSAFDLKKKV